MRSFSGSGPVECAQPAGPIAPYKSEKRVFAVEQESVVETFLRDASLFVRGRRADGSDWCLNIMVTQAVERVSSETSAADSILIGDQAQSLRLTPVSGIR